MFCSYLVLVLDLCFTVYAPCRRCGSELTLALLVTWVVADNHDATVTTNDFALVADLLNAWVNLHDFFLFICSDK
jgi:hypothetical protein